MLVAGDFCCDDVAIFVGVSNEITSYRPLGSLHFFFFLSQVVFSMTAELAKFATGGWVANPENALE